MKNLDNSILANLKKGDDKSLETALELMQEQIAEKVRADFEELGESADEKILAQRGYRLLTSKEKDFYNKFIEASKSADYKQAITNLDVAFPETVIEAVFKEMTANHPLISAVNFTAATLATKVILADHSTPTAAWGEINGAITQEIAGAIRKLDLGQNKLTAFAVIPLDMLDMGPVFVDRYIRALLAEGMALQIEEAIVNGTGNNMPIGLNRDIHEGVSVSGGVYPLKEAKVVKDFTPVTYGDLLSTLATTEKGNVRTFTKVALIVNPVDYYTKVMPATTVLNTNGTYVNNVLPFPTDVIPCSRVEQNKAILAILPEYFFGVASGSNPSIEYSDEFKFLDDVRTYKTKFYGNGRAYDNTCAIYLDITNIDPAFITVKSAGEVASV